METRSSLRERLLASVETQIRKKWTSTRNDLENGDLIMTDKQVYHGEWRLARVIDAMNDGVHSRNAIVKKVYERDRTKLVLLELDGDLKGD